MKRSWLARSVLAVAGTLLAMAAAPGGAAAATRWSVVPSPSPSDQANYLSSVDGIASNDVWAVGAWYRPIATPGTLVEHWDGSSWSLVATPPLSAGFSELTGVAAVASNDVWAVGSTGGAPLIEHWDGSAWTVVPGASQEGELYSVSASSATDIWAVGEVDGGPGSVPLVEHWNGTAWSVVSVPSGRKPFTALTSVTAVATGDAWAVGQTYDPISVVYRTFALHWDGTQWTASQTPNPSNEYDSLGGVAVQSGSVWAVGAADTATLVLRTTDG